MPISKKRKSLKPAYIPPTTGPVNPVKIGSPAWLVPTMVTMFILGLLWIVIFYLAGSQVPVMQDLSNLVNVLVGFVFIGIGFALATRWR
jgi:threonine/homoserine/homoserine lactone efflux protein